MSIHILPPEVVDQIAAGEVVERPSHLVKELVENAFDAGATRIDLDISEGGRQVQVVDDGHGISPEDLPLTIQRHATSKIAKAEDLWRLSTFGFRGEALAAIAAVSRLDLISKTKEADTAYRLSVAFGKSEELEPIGGAFGTKLALRDLFENVPARLKFMKSEVAEHTNIRNTVKALALSRPDVEFSLKEGGRLVLFYARASSLKERAEQVLEVPLFEASADLNGFKVTAAFSDPSQVAKTSKNIWMFVQGRWVQDRSLQHAVMESYRSLLMHGEFPFAVVKLTCPPDQVDVNIHPTKSQVKFMEPSAAFRAIVAGLRREIDRAPWQQIPLAPTAAPSAVVLGDTDAKKQNITPGGRAVEHAVLEFSDEALKHTQFAKKTWDFGTKAEARPVLMKNESAKGPATSSPANAPSAASATKAAGGYWSSLDVLGQLNLTYIIAQSAQAMILVDQHAAHERVVYEKLIRAWRGGAIEIQDFLFPLAVDLSAEQVEALIPLTEDLKKLGLHIETLGPSTIGVKAGPALLKDSIYAEVLTTTAQQAVKRGASFHFDSVVEHLCATMACHSVVRAGQTLSIEQMKSLLADMDEFPHSGYCPHGRPVSVDWGFTALDKEFGRIP